MGAIVQGLTFILSKIAALAAWLGQLVVKVFESVWLLLQDGVCWTFEQFLKLSVGILGALDFTALSTYAGSWAGLPAGVLEVLAAIGLGTALGIVVSAITIRLMLQLIPFTRLGS